MRTRYSDGRLIARGFWPWLTALALGVLLVLWLTGGDRDVSANGAEFVASATATRETTAPTGDIHAYEIRFADGTAITLMGSRAVPMIQFLAQHPRVTVELRPREIQRVER